MVQNNNIFINQIIKGNDAQEIKIIFIQNQFFIINQQYNLKIISIIIYPVKSYNSVDVFYKEEIQ